MARYVRSVRDKLCGLVNRDSGVELQELVLRLLRDDELLDHGEVSELLGEAVHTAATRGSERALAALLNVSDTHHGVFDIDQQDTFGYTLLMLAVQHGQMGATEQLLGHGANVTLRSNAGATALDMAARGADVAIMRLIAGQTQLPEAVSVGSAKTQEKFWYTALTAAAEKGHTQAVHMLLHHGINPNLNHDTYIGSALHCAVESGVVACVDVLLQYGADIESLRRCVQQTPLMRACEYGHVDIVRRLLTAGANVHRQTAHCSNALTVACHYGNQRVAEVLLEHGADPHSPNPWGFTPLYMSTDSPGILQLLVQMGVDVNIQCGERREAALHLAAVIGFLHVCQILLDAGADVDSLTAFDESPLWLTIWKGHDDVARHFIQENCELNIPSNGCEVYLWHYTPMELALGSGKLQLANMLYEAGCPLRNPFYFSPADPAPLTSLPRVQLRGEILQYTQQQDPELYHWLATVSSTPRTLLQLARISIRAAVGKKPRKRIESLPLPPMLKSYVAMEY